MPRKGAQVLHPAVGLSLGRAFVYGTAAGLLGTIAMTIAEKLEQSVTQRPNSLVPGYTMQRLFNLAPRPESAMDSLNLTMHFGQGVLVAGVRGVMAFYGVTGPFSSFMFMGVRLLVDQTLENITGVGAKPWTWPVDEQIIDLLHKAVYAFTTGYLVDRWTCSVLGS